MKRYIPLLLVAILAVAILTVVPAMFDQQQALNPYIRNVQAAIPTSIPDLPGSPNDFVDRHDGGIYKAGIAIEPEEAEDALVIKNYSSAVKPLDLQNSSGTSVFSVDNDGDVAMSGAVSGLGVSQWTSTAFTYTAATGFDDGVVTVVPVGQIWAVHSVRLKTTENVVCTGDDETLVVGDAGDADGFLVVDHTDLTTTYTEVTGMAAGWAGALAANVGVYFDEATTNWGGNAHILDNSAGTAPITITATLAESSGETITAGAFTVYVNYTKIED